MRSKEQTWGTYTQSVKETGEISNPQLDLDITIDLDVVH